MANQLRNWLITVNNPTETESKWLRRISKGGRGTHKGEHYDENLLNPKTT